MQNGKFNPAIDLAIQQAVAAFLLFPGEPTARY
jgi:hypothetical protein